MMQRLIPKIFHAQIAHGIDFFVDGLGLEVLHRDDTLTVIAGEGCKAYLVRNTVTLKPWGFAGVRGSRCQRRVHHLPAMARRLRRIAAVQRGILSRRQSALASY
jgi:hypothetical protein